LCQLFRCRLFCKGQPIRFPFRGRNLCCFVGELFPFLLFDAGLSFGFRIVGGARMAGEGSGGGAGTTNSGAGDWSSAMMAGAGCFGAATATGGLGRGSAAAILAGGAASAMVGPGTTIVGAGGAGDGGSGWLKLTTAGAVATAGSTDGGGVGSGGEGIVGAALATGWESGAIRGSMR
jgi:hypothetical protein